ncbi:MAG: peptidase [Solirubrobacterales bacterium]|nr:peptidase [Solirubrobacterales bacterium]
MPDDVLMFADTARSPELRHEIPTGIVDPFLYAERDGRRYAVLSQLDADGARAAAPGLEVLTPEELGQDELLGSGLSRHEVQLEVALIACRRLEIARAAVPPGFPLDVADYLRGAGIEVEVDRQAFVERRLVKNAAELAGIRRAQRAAEAGMRAAVELLRAAEPADGVVLLDGQPLTSERLKVDIEAAFAAHGAAVDEVLASHGPQTAVGHHMGSGPIAPGEPIVIDLWPADRATGCFSDMTRSFVVGDPGPELREWYALSREALERAVAATRPGVTGFELFKLVCDLFEEHGHPTQLSKKPGEVLRDGFFHGLGHGVGLEVHEEPSLGRTGSDPLRAGEVVALEPGLYRHGYGGCRIEDLVLVTEDGAEVLTDFPYELEVSSSYSTH